ncbi:MAG TPA: amidohydrolase [Thermoleophilaceae bacterium]
MSCDLVLHGGPVRTLDPAAPLAYELAICQERVVAAPVPGAERIDLAGRCVVPGLADAHVHFPTWSLAQRQVRLEGAHSLDDALAGVAAALPGVPSGGWLRGVGWRDGDWTEPPTRAALDRVAPKTPVALFSRDYHSLWLNGAALAQADGPLEPPGGVVERDERGQPTGVLRENAAWAFRDRYVRPTVDEMVTASREGLRIAAARGVTAIHDKDGWLGAFEVFARLRERGELSLRVWQSFPWDRLDELRALGLRSGFGDDLLRVGYLKGFMDGTLGSATARLLDGSGVEITSRDELEEVVRRAAEAHFPVAVHAIGDAANRAALDAFAATRDAWQPARLRPRIEHAQLLAADDVPRFAEIGVAASVQFSHAPSDRDLADRLWEGRDGAYAYRSLLDAGALLANGSDAPVEELDPLAGIVAGVRRTLDERPPWRPEQAVTVEEALRAATVAPAWLEGQEHRRGTLRPGMLADLVVLDRDPLTCPPEELPGLRLLATMVGGRWTHLAPEGSAASLSRAAARPSGDR